MFNLKEHVKEHKHVYILGTSIVLTAGITWLIVRKNLDLPCGPSSDLLRGSEARSFSFFVNGNQTSKAVTTIHTGVKGNPGFVTRSLDTGELFSTQNAAAKAFDISPSILSSHLNGKFDNAEGYHFERIGMLN